MSFLRTKSGTGSIKWLLLRISALLAICFVIIHYHFVITRFLFSGTVTYQELTQRIQKPWLKASEICFFSFCALHGCLGLMSLFDMIVKNPAKNRILKIAAMVLCAGVAGAAIVIIILL